MSVTELLKCPVCGREMTGDGKSLICGGERRHLFDIASTGYVNLLSPGKGKNARTGDEKSMIASRARFLDRGYYGEISRRIGGLISELAENDKKSSVAFADCACGEGYHTCNIFNTIAEYRVFPTALAFDASKHGASYGAKRASRLGIGDRLRFVAANIFSLPVKDGSFDFALSVFAPIAGDEMMRILKPDGKLIVASSGEKHLFELRKAVYDEPREASGSVRCPEGFAAEREELISYRASIEGNDAVRDLFYMTPFCHKTSRQDIEKLSEIESLDVTVAVKLTVFGKKT